MAIDKKGVGIRARIEHVMKAGFASSLDALLKSLKVTPEQTDLIVDLGTPNYEPYSAFAAALALAAAVDAHPVAVHRDLRAEPDPVQQIRGAPSASTRKASDPPNERPIPGNRGWPELNTTRRASGLVQKLRDQAR